MKFIHKNKVKILLLCLLIIATIPVILPLLQKGFFVSDDGEWMIIRFSAFHQALRDGQIPVRYLSRLNHGFGYPVANFLYPGFMYLAEPFKLFGFGFVNSVKIVVGLSLLGSGIFTYLWLGKRFVAPAALVGALFYLYTPYHLYDIYKRGSVGEILALAVLPFVLWNIERKSLFWTAVGIGLLILSHNTLAVLFLPLVVLYMILSPSKGKDYKKKLFESAATLVTGLGLSAFFWLPAVVELQYTRFSSVTVSDFQQYFADIKLIGVSSLFLVGLAFFVLYKQKQDSSTNRLYVLFICLAVLSIVFASSFSTFLWEFLPVSLIQFPFRLLSYLIVGVSFISAYCINYFTGRLRILLLFVLIILLIPSGAHFIQPQEYFDKGEGYYSTNEGTTTVKNEYMPKWVKNAPSERADSKVIVAKGTVKNIESNSKQITAHVQVPEKTKVFFQTIFYPGWRAYVDGVAVPITVSGDRGIIVVAIPEGEHIITITFSENLLRVIADVISFLTLILLGSFVLVVRKK